MASVTEQLQALEQNRIVLLERIHAAYAVPARTDILEPQTGHQSISDEQKAYNAIMKEISLLNAPISCDPVEVLPFEIFIGCIQLALPVPERGYTTSLLQLTMVSTRWSQAIMSTPTLWAVISVNNDDADSLAMITTSLQLSRDTMISLMVRIPLGDEWNEASEVILPHSNRIQRIITLSPSASDPFTFMNFNPVNQGYINILELVKILGSLGTTSSVDSLVSGTVWRSSMPPPGYTPHSLPALPPGGIKLPQNLCYMGNWEFQLDSLKHMNSSFSNLRELHTTAFIDVLLPMLYGFPQLEALFLSGPDEVLGPGDISQPSNYRVPQRPYGLKRLRTFHCTQPFSHTVPTLLGQVATNLTELCLRVPYRLVEFLIGVLEDMSRLQQLSLIMSALICEIDSALVGSNGTAAMIPTLWSLAFRDDKGVAVDDEMKDDPSYCQSAFEYLISALAMLYPNVKVAHIERGPIIEWEIVAPFLADMQYLRSLWITGRYQPMYEINVTLPELETLRIRQDNILPSITTPKLLQLTHDGRSFEMMEEFCCNHFPLQTLDTGYWSNSDHEWLDPGHPEYPIAFMHIQNLHLRIGGALTNTYPTIYLVSFPSLIKIVISESVQFSNQATFLCLSLLYQPEACPRLQELEFGSLPEWDCLFLMLERRNFHRNQLLSRISKISVPFVPYHLRSSLSTLLRGEFAARPCNYDLSINGTKEALFDASMYVVQYA
ncbi:hypothetical protein M408DRAFT_27779 [Serendipita vermifera MAFF 305830]|uniref:F-box domain-containing protein n=1 Tax=Serendipita vermifera MAFF 305830 TaxID=933852 RepID=A0A0C3AU63_SERVB|nr:hypothetical protein M408DRAFT_27779 [Serendipita vermifera MAFF 305830]